MEVKLVYVIETIEVIYKRQDKIPEKGFYITNVVIKGAYALLKTPS